eukprot:m.133833 g.133833  ORF g.133833 m.133833 type:complete len:336 (-) comp29697_c0_seq1:165-1172(-)
MTPKSTTSSVSASAERQSQPQKQQQHQQKESKTVEHNAISLDERVGKWIYDQTQGNPRSIKIMLEAGSMSGDEIIWFLLPAVYISSMFALRLAGAAVMLFSMLASDGSDTQLQETLCSRARWEDGLGNLFGTLGVCCSLEMFFKLIFRRARPWYCKKQGKYVIPGEVFSMPSGHTLRATTLAFWLTKDVDALLLLEDVGLSYSTVGLTVGTSADSVLTHSIRLSTTISLIIWVTLIIFARIGLGKHYPTDCAAGALVGVLNGWFLTHASFPSRNAAKIVGGTILTASWGVFYFAPEVAKLSGLSKRLILVIYFIFYSLMLFSRSPQDWSADPLAN